MPWIRQLHRRKCPDYTKSGPGTCDGCGSWAATVYTGKPRPNDRITRTHRLKPAIEKWAAKTEAEIEAGKFHDTRPGNKTTFGQLWAKYPESRHFEEASRNRDASHWKVHVAPTWENLPVGPVTKAAVSAWVVQLERSHRDDCRRPKSCPGCRVGAATVEGALGVLRGLCELAFDMGIITANPARKITMAPRDAHVDRILTPAEEDLIVARARDLFGERVDGVLMIETDFETAMRWEELAALPPEMIDTTRRRIHIAWVMERSGIARPYAKTEAGNRTVGYGDHIAERLAAAKANAPECPGVFPASTRKARMPTRLVFHTPQGAALRYPNWRQRVWERVLLEPPVRAVKRDKSKPGPAPLVPGFHYLEDPQPTFHDVRHTTITRVADGGVKIHDLMRFSGHGDPRSVMRYLHSTEARFGRIRDALKKAREQQPEGEGDEGDESNDE